MIWKKHTKSQRLSKLDLVGSKYISAELKLMIDGLNRDRIQNEEIRNRVSPHQTVLDRAKRFEMVWSLYENRSSGGPQKAISVDTNRKKKTKQAQNVLELSNSTNNEKVRQAMEKRVLTEDTLDRN